MNKPKYILAIDQGTSATKSLVFDINGNAIAKGSAPLHTNYFENGYVEQDPEGIIQNVYTSVSKCLQAFAEKGFDKNDIATIGISNQRETFVIWDKAGNPIHPAIVWQCKRSIYECEQLKENGLAETIQQKTGLVIDPYFSASKLIWLFKHNANIQLAIKNGTAHFGTIDTWLLFKLTNGKEYATDHTNASRTLFFNLHTLQWDHELIEAYGLTGINLPAIKASASYFGTTTVNNLFLNAIPITALIGDSHAAAFGEGCFDVGTAKATMGTGCSVLMNIGNQPMISRNGMVTTVCWSIENRIDYAYEGVIVSCGATLEWLKNELNLFSDSTETENMATAVSDNGGVYLIPAFSGLGSPYWQMERRASISGLSFGTTKNHIVRAALESIPYQIMDVITAMEKDAQISLKELNADGGIANNEFIMQFMANLLNKNVAHIGMPDVSALGAAFLAGLTIGIYHNIDSLKKIMTNKKYYTPLLDTDVNKQYQGWQKAIKRP